MLNEKFHKELKKGLPNFLYFLWSKESFFLEEALAEATDVVIASHQKDFNYDVFYPSASPREILDTALTLPFLAPRRLVVLKDFHEFSKPQIEVLNSYFKKPCETTCMLILSNKEPESDLNIVRYIYPLRIKESDIPAWLKEAADKKGIKLSKEAVDYLIESVGHDVGALVMEIEKLTLSGVKTIEGKDVISSTGMMRGYIPFDLVDALIAGKKTKALRILKTLIEGRTFDAPAVLGTLNWHYREFYRLWESKGKRPLKMREATFRTLLKYLSYFTQECFYKIFQNLHEADLEIKTSAKPELALEILLLKLLQIRDEVTQGTKN